MKCVICKRGEITRGDATVTVRRGHSTIVIKAVPADICATCGEYYLDEKTAQCVSDIVDQRNLSTRMRHLVS